MCRYPTILVLLLHCFGKTYFNSCYKVKGALLQKHVAKIPQLLPYAISCTDRQVLKVWFAKNSQYFYLFNFFFIMM